MHFTVLGAGVVGLATALELQTNFPDAQVTIVADKFGVETTSDVAAGIFRPSTSFTGPTEQITRQANVICTLTYVHLKHYSHFYYYNFFHM